MLAFLFNNNALKNKLPIPNYFPKYACKIEMKLSKTSTCIMLMFNEGKLNLISGVGFSLFYLFTVYTSFLSLEALILPVTLLM